jgi:tetratricopeptide (TPR) repeat protein
MKHARRFALLLTMLLLAGPAAAAGDPGAAVAPANSDYAFGMHLFETGDYYRAITAFKRHAFFQSDSTRQQALYMIPLCAYGAGRYGEAIGGFADYARSTAPARLKEASAYYHGCCWLLLGQYQAAETLLAEAAFTDDALREQSAFAGGWAQLLAGEWSRASESMQRYTTSFPQGAGRPLAERIVQDLAQEPRFGWRSERLALLCAVVPGGGQLYAGRRADAIYSAMLIGASLLLAVNGAREDSDVAVSVGSVLSVSLYVGSIYGGVNAVRKYNIKQWERSLTSYRGELPADLFAARILP